MKKLKDMSEEELNEAQIRNAQKYMTFHDNVQFNSCFLSSNYSNHYGFIYLEKES